MKDDGRTLFHIRIDGVPEAIADPEEKIGKLEKYENDR